MMVTSSVQLLIVNVRKREEEDQEQECKKRGKGSWWCHVAWLEWKSGLGAFNNKSKEQRVSLSPAMSERNPVLWPRRIRICVCLSLSTTSFSLYRTTSTNNNNNNNNNSYLFFSLYLFICLPSLSLSSYLSSPCIHALIPFSAYPLSPFFHSSHAIPLPASIWSIAHAGMLVNFPPLLLLSGFCWNLPSGVLCFLVSCSCSCLISLGCFVLCVCGSPLILKLLCSVMVIPA